MHLQRLVDAGADDARHHRARHLQRHVAVVVADRLDADHVAVVGAAGQRRAVHDLQPLGIFERASRARAPDPCVTWLPPTGMASRMDELAVGKHRDRGRAAAHVDAGRAHLQFVVDQRGKPAGIGRRHHALDRKMRAVDAELEIAQRRCVAGQHMHVDAELRRRPCRADRGCRARRRARNRSAANATTSRSAFSACLAPAASTRLMSACVDLVAAEIDRGGEGFALQPAGRDIDDERNRRSARPCARRHRRPAGSPARPCRDRPPRRI